MCSEEVLIIMEAVFEYEMAVVAILKNEGNYIKEWLDYHMSAGVTKFYLYDNESKDNLKNVLQPYIDAEIVDYTYWPGTCMQLKVYNDALEKHRFDCHYMAFIDADEFIYPKDDSTITEAISSIMSLDPLAGGVVINWRMFGSSGLLNKNLNLGVLDRFKLRAKDDFSANIHIKTVVNPRRVTQMVHVHYAAYLTGMYAVDEHGNKVELSAVNDNNTVDRICLNHYFTKSLEEWTEKRARGTADANRIRPMKDFQQYDRNDVYDDGIIKYWESCKNRKLKTHEQNIYTALQNMLELFEEKVMFPINVSIETVLCFWYMCNKYHKIFLKKYEEHDIMHFFVKIIQDKLALNISEWECVLLRRNIINFIEDCAEKSEIVKSILWKLVEIKARNARIENISLIKTFHETRVYINKDGNLIHYSINKDSCLLPVYAMPLFDTKYIFFIVHDSRVIYINKFPEDGKVILSVLPKIFVVEKNKIKTVSIRQEHGFVSAVSNGRFRIQPNNREWEHFFLEPANIDFDFGKYILDKVTYGKKRNMISREFFGQDDEKQSLIRDLCTSRVDIMNCGSGCDIEVKDMLVDNNICIKRAAELEGINSMGVTVQGKGENMKLFIRCFGTGMLNVGLKGVMRLTQDGKFLPYWITYTSVRVNENNILPKSIDVCYDRPIICRKEVQDGETLILDISWQPCMKSVKDLLLVE